MGAACCNGQSVVPDEKKTAQVTAVPSNRCLMNTFYTSGQQCKVQEYCATPGDITKEWLGGALDAKVLSFGTEICEQGQCALTVLIKDIQYAPGTSGRPKSLAMKMHGQTEQQRTMFSGLGHFTREVYFYTTFSGKVPLKSPVVYGVWTDDKGGNLSGQDAPPVEYFNMLMADMNEEWKTFNPVIDGLHTTLEETEQVLMQAREMHVKFFKSPEIMKPPFSKTGAKFTLDAKRPYVGYAVASWPPVKANMPALAGWDAFPSHATELVSFYDNFLANGGSLASRFIDALEKVFQSRPMTLNHGDFNCGNIWQNKAKPSQYSYGDWQMYEMAPIGLDIESLLVTLGDGDKVTKLMDKYHAGLPINIQQEYSRSQLQDDFKGQLVVVAIIIVAIMAGQLDPSGMPEAKFGFCWKILWPKAFFNFGNLFRDLQVPDFARSLVDGIKEEDGIYASAKPEW